MENFYTAQEAAKLLGLQYHTFLARAKAGRYTRYKFGWGVFFDKREIDEHVVGSKPVEGTEG